jgi:hypothetical protein
MSPSPKPANQSTGPSNPAPTDHVPLRPCVRPTDSRSHARPVDPALSNPLIPRVAAANLVSSRYSVILSFK